jgi:hypothetical protein
MLFDIRFGFMVDCPFPDEDIGFYQGIPTSTFCNSSAVVA